MALRNINLQGNGNQEVRERVVMDIEHDRHVITQTVLSMRVKWALGFFA
jgi:hypothetical protein